MKVTEGKRLAAILGAYIAVFSACVLVPAVRPYILWIGLLCAAVFSAVLLFREKRKRILLQKSVLILLMVISVVSASVFGMKFLSANEFAAARYLDGEAYEAEGYITEILYEENYGSCYRIRLMELNRKETELSAMLSLPYNGAFCVGDILAFEGVFSLPEEDSVIYRRAEGIFLSAEAEAAEKTGTRETGKTDRFQKIRLYMQRNFERFLEKHAAGFATAITTGNRENLSGEIKLAFSRIGISHVLAVSGLHLAIVIGGLDLLFRWVAIPRKLKNLILIVCACLLACICGLSASVIRAAIMLSLMYLADTIGENGDSLTSLFIAIFLLLVFRPTAVYDIGMWMSFLATLGIVLTLPVIPKMKLRKCPRLVNKILNFVISLLCITVSATFFTLPVTYMAFSGISLLSLVSNLLFVPLIQMILYLLTALTLIGGNPFLAEQIGTIAGALISFVCDTAVRLSDIRGICVSLRYPFAPWVIALLVVGVLAVLMIKRVKMAYIFAVFAACFIFYAVGCIGYTHMEGEKTCVYLETDGKSDAVGIVSEGKTVLVDISTGGYPVLGRAADHIEDFCECELDVLVLTHYHFHHPNTLRKLMNRLKIHHIYLPEPITEDDLFCYRAICDQLDGKAEITVYSADGTEDLQIGNVSLSLPDTEYIERSTHPIVRFSGAIGEKGFAYLGEGATERDLSADKNEVMIFGSNGPSVKHIFDSEPIAHAELVIFADPSHAELTDTEIVTGKIAFPEDYGGWIKILFE